ncbi:hypothetical protein BGY98DRAFT_963032 [Russula aff. rugulosa BPL654]|nr:hypothetical protein BGY98DRAFT_963032 [Russula aff. rugulosa BPL654]
MVLGMPMLRIVPLTCLAVSGLRHGFKACSGQGHTLTQTKLSDSVGPGHCTKNHDYFAKMTHELELDWLHLIMISL